MPLLSSAIPNLVNGVSQQAASLRLSSQLESQENAYSSIVEGLGKRAPSKHIKKLAATDVSSAYFHLINRDSTERYSVVMTNGDLFVYDLNGVAKTVAFPDGKTYLNTATPNTVMRALTVADYTFVLNTATVTAMAATLSASNLGKALVSIKQGQYSTQYFIKIGGVTVAAYTTSDTAVADLKTSGIANQLLNNMGLASKPYVTAASYVGSTKRLTQAGRFAAYTWTAGDIITISGGTRAKPGDYEVLSKVSNDTIELAAHPTTYNTPATNYDVADNTLVSPIPTTDIGTNYNFSRVGSTILITKRDGTAIDCTVEDSFGNRAMTVSTDVVQRFADLPTVAPAGFVTKIVGDTTSTSDDYYVKFVPYSATELFGNGNWVETVGPSVQTTINAATMPHILVREIDGTFTFRRATWTGRTVGDATSSPDPSFIGNELNDIFFFRDRLGLLSQENVILSVAGGFFSFFSQTVTTVLDSDPVDVAATHTRVSHLKHAIPFREELLLFSDQAQFVLSSSSILTPTSVTIDQTTEFEASLRARPVGAGNNIYFAFPRGSFAGVREYFVQRDSDTKDASDVTSHCPKYIPGAITKMAAATNEDVLVALSSTDQDGFYIYKYYWLNDQKLQSSWSHFGFEASSKVLSADFIESTLYMIVQRSDGHHLETMSFEPGQADTGSAYVSNLDRRLDETGVTSIAYSAVTGLTTWTLPYTITSTMKVVVRAGDATLREGTALNLASQGGTTITAVGDYTSTKVYIGQTYTMTVQLSEPVLREEARGGGQSVVSAGRLQIRNYTVVYNATGYFVTEVTPTGRTMSTKVFNGLTAGVSAIGNANLASGKFRFPVFAQSNQAVMVLESDSFLPCHFTGAEWEGHYTSRSQRA